MFDQLMTSALDTRQRSIYLDRNCHAHRPMHLCVVNEQAVTVTACQFQRHSHVDEPARRSKCEQLNKGEKNEKKLN